MPKEVSATFPDTYQIDNKKTHSHKARKINFRIDIQNARGIAIIFIVASHLNTIQPNYQYSKLLTYAVSDFTVWFIFLAGYFFSRNDINNFSYKTFLLKKLHRVIAPYLIITTICSLVALYFSHNIEIDLNWFEFILWNITVGGNIMGPLWFIPMIIIIYTISPLITIITNSKIFFGFVVFTLLISIFSGRPYPNLNPPLSFIHFFGIYMFGIYYQIHEDGKFKLFFWHKKIYFTLLLMSFAMQIIAANADNYNSGFFESLFVPNWLTIARILQIICFLELSSTFFSRRIFLLSYAGEISFPIFFTHYILVIAFRNIFISGHAYFKIPLNPITEFIFVYILTIFLVKIIKATAKENSHLLIGQ